mgnify:CR=1 FL=1
MATTQPVAKAIILDSQAQFLLLQRSDTHPTLAGFYDLPGGSISENEEPGAAVIREVQEETGLHLAIDRIKILYTTTQLLHGRSYPTLLYIAYLAEQAPEVQMSWEHKSYEWAPLDRLVEVEPQLASTYREALEYIRAHDILEDIAN